MRLLIVSDGEILARSIRGILNDVNPTLVTTNRIDEACNLLQTDIFDMVLLDLDMLSGRARQVLEDCPPTIFTMAIGSQASKAGILSAIQAGATDFVLKPLDPLLFKLRVGMARAQPPLSRKPQVTFGRLTFNVVHNSIELDGHFLSLTPKESTVLLALMRRGGSPVNKEFISRSIATEEEYASNAAIEVCVHRLRRKLVDAGVTIETVRGVGYALQLQAPASTSRPHS
ncbi:MAG: winged helix-turn-helix domain-containing protein [Hyphomicrobiaceae bacterium]